MVAGIAVASPPVAALRCGGALVFASPVGCSPVNYDGTIKTPPRAPANLEIERTAGGAIQIEGVAIGEYPC